MFSQKLTVAVVFLASTALSELLIRFKTKFTHLCLVTAPGVPAAEKLHHRFVPNVFLLQTHSRGFAVH